MSAADLRRWWFPAGAGAVAERALVWVEGPDAASFLQGLLSNDVFALGDGDACRALLLDAKGRIGAAMAVHRDGPRAFTLVCEPHLGERLMGILERYHFSEDLELLGPEPATVLVIGTEGALPDAPELVVSGLIPGTREVAVDDPQRAADALGLWLLDEATLERARIAAGAPRVGVDTAERTLVQEAGLEERAVSFTKGCYLGQETVARAQYRGRVNRVLRIVEFDGPAPTAPVALHRDEREVGTLTSCVALPGGGALGLAILRREAEPGEAVRTADGAHGQVEEIEPFAVLGPPDEG
ncbi:MAG TPA: hypothetical protein PKE32_05495 [Miltoncostaeaceae bacterium]|nr:hypothetical protein [Miltoncostaeaceae bacterium]